MKKGLVIALAVLMVAVFAGTAMADPTTTITMKAEVAKYITVIPDFTIDLGIVYGPTFNKESAVIMPVKGMAYANFPFQVTMDVSRVSRQELDENGVPIPGQFDYINVYLGTGWNAPAYWLVNGVQTDISRQYPPWTRTYEFNETAHNGQVALQLGMHRMTAEVAAGGWGASAYIEQSPPGGTAWNDPKSPDAGPYEGTIVLTYSAI